MPSRHCPIDPLRNVFCWGEWFRSPKGDCAKRAGKRMELDMSVGLDKPLAQDSKACIEPTARHSGSEGSETEKFFDLA